MTLRSYWELIRGNRNFRLLWLAQIVSELGDWFYSVAIYSYLIEITGSAQMVAFAFVLQVLPQAFLAPTAGVINDRVSRRKVMIFADIMRALIVLSMVLVRTRGMIWLLFVLLFLETLCFGLFEPGRNAVIPNITGGNEIAVANALSAATWSFNFAVGAGIGGLAAVWLGRPAVFLLNSLSFVASAVLIGRMRFAEPHTENLAPLRGRDLVDFSPIVEGVRYVGRDRKLLTTIFVKGGIGLGGTGWVILPLMGETIFRPHLRSLSTAQAGMLGMSVLMASRGLGAMFGAYLGGNLAGIKMDRLRWSIVSGFLMTAAGYLALGAAGSLFAASLAALLANCGSSAAWTSSTTLLQQQTDDRFRGRVFSAEFAFMTLTLALVSFTAGRLADWGIDIRTIAYGTGALLLAPTVIWFWASRGWRDTS